MLGKEQDPHDLACLLPMRPCERHRAKEGISREGLDLEVPVACPEVLNQGTTILSHQGREIRKGKRCSKDWRRVCSTGLETKKRVCPHTQMIQGVDHTTVAVEILKAATGVLAQEKQSLLPKNVITKEHPHEGRKRCRKAKVVKENIESQSQGDKSRVLRTSCLNHGEDPEDHLKIFQAAAKTERWAMPTWCHMFNSILTGNTRVWFDDLSKESIDSYDDLKEAFLENYLQQKNALMIRSKFTISSREMENPRKNSRGGKFKPPPPMTTSVEKRNASKFCEFHREVGHTTDEYMHLKRPIEEMLKAGKPSHLIKELKQSSKKDQVKAAIKRETSGKERPMAILMVQSWQRVSKQKITRTFSPESVISFPPLGEKDGTEGPMIIEAEMGGHFVHRMYVNGGSSLKILYEHCFNRFRPEIGDDKHSTSAWMNFIVVRSPSPYNGIIGRPGVRRIQAVPSTTHRMLKFLVASGTVTLRSSMIIPLECTMVSGPGVQQPVVDQVIEEKIQVAIHPEYMEQTIAIGSTLAEKGRKELCGLLRCNLDIFSWKPADMTGVPRHIGKHRLNIRKGCLPVRQKKKGQTPERNKAIYEEVKKAGRRWHHERSLLSQLAVKPSNGEEA
uniref:Reverse transcriptase domain-containing protein n=1 Tax=Tanacetum cinerariifolium TaxID=118510 RepID=A0A6L2JC36_TANCI|nr:reverse transcriptase domain-containing protein [Tanacetum cinerariifolium]